MIFASDNWAGAHKSIAERLLAESAGFAAAYGNSDLDKRVEARFSEIFEREVSVFFVATGTAANSLALASVQRPGGITFCHSEAHVIEDECGAPEFFSNGSKLLVAASPGGKLTPDSIREVALKRQDIHYPKPRVVTITQSTETGQVYSLAEIRAISATCRELGLKLHMDGARFANACAHLGCSPAEMTWQSGVDVRCFGGTKNGMGVGEAVLFFNPVLAEDFDYRCKQAGQLASKMRFLAAPWAAALQDGSWLRHAAHANACARLLAEKVQPLPGVRLLYPVQANAVFLELPEKVHRHLKAKGWVYYVFIGGGARLMCSWATTEAEVNELAADISEGAGV